LPDHNQKVCWPRKWNCGAPGISFAVAKEENVTRIVADWSLSGLNAAVKRFLNLCKNCDESYRSKIV